MTRNFQRFRIAIFALMAVLVGSLIAIQGETVTLNLAVEWFEGFTGHMDGIGLATTAALAAPKTKDAEERTVDLDEDTLDTLVDKALERALDKQLETPKQEQRKAPELNPQENPATFDFEAYVVNERKLPWEARQVKAFNALSLANNGQSEQARALMQEVIREQKEMGSVQAAAERKAAFEVLRTAEGRDGKRLFQGVALQRAMTTLSDGAGGSAVATPLAAELFVIIERDSIARQYSRPLNMTSKSIDLASVATKPTVYWKAENALFQESNPVLSDENFAPYKLTSLMAWSHELDEDQNIALLPYRIALIGEGFAEKEDIAFFQGDGTATYGNVTGLLNLASANGVTMASTKDAHTDVTLANFKALRDAVPIRRRQGAAYFMNPAIKSIVETLANATAATDFPAVTKNQNGEIVRLWGFPIVESDDMPATAGADAPFVVFGTPQRHTLRGQRAGFETMISREGSISDGDGVVTYNALAQDGVILAVRERVGYVTPVGVQSAFSILTTAAS